MPSKLAAHFRSSPATSHSYQRLKQCKGCGNYSSLWIDRCLRCGAERKFVEVPSLVRRMLKQNAQRDVLILGAGGLAAFFLARSFMEMAMAAAGCALLIILYLLLRRRYFPYLEKKTLRDLLIRDNPAIREGLLRDIEDAAADLKADDYKPAYEKLREIGYLISSSHVKVLKMMCLNHFVLRKDMELELSTLLPDTFDPEFIHYLYEVSKVSPELIKRDIIEYAAKHRAEIESLPGGRSVLVLVVTAALRVKAYVIQFQNIIADYVDDLPRDRLLRLCRLVAESPETLPALYLKAMETAKRKYELDPEFQGLF